MDFKFIKHSIYKGERYLKDDEIQLPKAEAEDLAERGFGVIIESNGEDDIPPKGDDAPEGDDKPKTKKGRKAASGK